MIPQIDSREPDEGWRWYHSPLIAIETLSPGWWHIQTVADEPRGLWLSVSVAEYGGSAGAERVPQVGEIVSWYGNPTYARILTIGERLIYDHTV